MADKKLNEISISEARELLEAGKCTSVQITEACLNAIAETDEDIGAYLEVFRDALSAAELADKKWGGNWASAPALAGIPIAIKDNMLMKGKRSTAGSKILEGHVGVYDSTVVAKLKNQDAVILGRTNMDEFAMGSSTETSAWKKTKNPRDTARVPGGSSGGSAAAMAGQMALGTYGSDTGGSVRQPAALCGVVGLKPTYGAVSRYGLMALASSLDQIGPFAKTVSDAEKLFYAIEGEDKMDSTTWPNSTRQEKRAEPTAKRIGVPRAFFEKGLDQDMKSAFEKALTDLEKSGYEIVDIELPNAKYALPVYYIIQPAEASANLARFDGVRYGLHVPGATGIESYFKTRGMGFGTETRRRIILGTYVLSAGYYDAYYGKACAVRELIKDDYRKAWEKCDVIAMPTTPSPAFKFGEKSTDPVSMYLEDIFTVSANIAGVPAISIPCGFAERDGKKLPLGIQFTAPELREDRLFAVGKDYEAVRG